MELKNLASLFLILLSLFSLNVNALNEAALRQQFQQPFQNDGPNCFNTVFVALGYVQNILHTSTNEAEFYLKNFCQLKTTAPAKAEQDSIIAYYNATSDLVHTAVALGDGQVLEKYTYEGFHRSTPKNQNKPGEYLFQNLASSYYFKNYSSKKIKVFQCVDVDEFRKRLSELNSLPVVQEIHRIRQIFALEIARTSPEALDVFFQGTALALLEDLRNSLNHNQRARVGDETQLQQAYINALATSILHQMDYLLEGAPISCKTCNKKLTKPVQEATRAVEYLLAKRYSANFS